MKYELNWIYFLSKKNSLKKIHFPYCKLGHFPLFYKSVMPNLKIQAINSIFWILVHMIATHHCAKEQHAQLNVAQMRTPYRGWQHLAAVQGITVEHSKAKFRFF